MGFDEIDLAFAVNAAKGEAGKAATVLKSLASEAIFNSGGWKQVEASTGMRAPDLLGFGASEADSVVPAPPPVLAAELASLIVENDANSIALTNKPVDPNEAVDLLIRNFNSQFAVVAEGGTTGIVRLAYNAELNLRSPTIMTLDSFRLLYGNRSVPIPRKSRSGDVEQQEVSATAVWLKHPARRTCPDGFGLDPTGSLPATCYNLWQGFGVEEKEGDWSKLHDLILNVLASGNIDHYTYIIHWLAHLVQRPHENPGVALVFRGDQGVGKGTLGRAIMRLMRPHAMQITHSKHLTGPFNAHMRMILYLFADEAFFAGDKANEGALKGLITEEFRVNEGKGRDATLGRNRLHLMMASNNEWVVPASADARRYAVFDVSSIHKQDLSYFGPIFAEMDVGGDAAGIAAMLFSLRRFEFDMDLIRRAPETTGLYSQRIASLRGPAQWLFDVMTRGCASESFSEPWREHYSTEELFNSYRSWSRDNNDPYPADRHALGRFLASMFPTYRPRVFGSTLRPPSYRFGPLAEARAIFAAKQGIGDPWQDGDGGPAHSGP